jgi:hypothetical protein
MSPAPRPKVSEKDGQVTLRCTGRRTAGGGLPSPYGGGPCPFQVIFATADSRNEFFAYREYERHWREWH